MGGLIHIRLLRPKVYSLAFSENTENQNMTDTGCDQDGILGGPTVAVAGRRQRQHPVRIRDELDVHLTAPVHSALVFAARRPELCGHARRTMGENSPEVNAETMDSSLR